MVILEIFSNLGGSMITAFLCIVKGVFLQFRVTDIYILRTLFFFSCACCNYPLFQNK